MGQVAASLSLCPIQGRKKEPELKCAGGGTEACRRVDLAVNQNLTDLVKETAGGWSVWVSKRMKKNMFPLSHFFFIPGP